MKKIIVTLLCGICLVLCAFALLACGDGNTEGGAANGGQTTGGQNPAAPHEHQWGEWELTTPATCMQAGVETRVCALDPTHKETRATEIDPDAHVWDEWQTDYPATCMLSGSKSRACKLNPEHTEREDILSDPDAHDWGEWQIQTRSTCSVAGVKVRYCKNNRLHSDTQPAEFDPANHTSYPVTVEALEPNCTEPGHNEYTQCPDCGLKYGYEEIPTVAGAHVFGDDNKCTKCGYVLDYTQAGLNFLDYPDGDECYVKSCDTDAQGDIVIPYFHDGKPVTGIGVYAFRECTQITSITIPASITHIDRGAFSRCTQLTTIYWNAVNCTLNGQNSYTNDSDRLFNMSSQMSTVIFGDTVKVIPECIFYRCSTLKNVTIGENVTEIAGSAFFYCTGLTELTIPENVIKIRSGAFYHCEGLKTVNWNAITYLSPNDSEYHNYEDPLGQTYADITTLTFGDKVEYVPKHLFGWFSEITEVTIPDSVKTIGEQAFEPCVKLATIHIGKNVTRIGQNAFLGTAYFKDKNNWTDGALYIDGYLIKGHDEYDFSGDDGGVDYITGGYTVIPGTKLIADYAFYYCEGLTDITIPASLKGIGSFAFNNNTQGIYITDIGAWCKMNFADGNALNGQTLYIDGEVAKDIYVDGTDIIRYDAFGGLANTDLNITISSSVTFIEKYAFGNFNIKSITFEVTDGWTSSPYEDMTDAVPVNLTDPEQNAKNLSTSHYYKRG